MPAAPTIIQGARSSNAASGISATTAILAASIVVNMDNDIFLLDGSSAPLALLSAKVSSSSVHRNRFDWLEDERIPSYVTVQTAATAQDVTIGLESGEADYFPLESTAQTRQRNE